MKTNMSECIENCQSCHTICLRTSDYCLTKGGEHVDPSHIRLLLDCAEICQTSANFMIHKSEVHQATCAACAEICDKCAEACESFNGDKQMEECARICRRCAESCREMSQRAAA